MEIDNITGIIINAVLKIHRDLDPGFYTLSASLRLCVSA
jgi:hypothetical protein